MSHLKEIAKDIAAAQDRTNLATIKFDVNAQVQFCGHTCEKMHKKGFEQDKVNTADSAFIFLIIQSQSQ